jgi:ABC-type phosphate transport system substrate-binding protein
MFKGLTWSLKALVIGVALGTAGSVSAQQTISIDGSTGTAPLVEALGRAFSAKRGITVQVGKGLRLARLISRWRATDSTSAISPSAE